MSKSEKFGEENSKGKKVIAWLLKNRAVFIRCASFFLWWTALGIFMWSQTHSWAVLVFTLVILMELTLTRLNTEQTDLRVRGIGIRFGMFMRAVGQGMQDTVPKRHE